MRKLSREEIGDLALDLPQQDHTGVSTTERFVVKNLIDDAPSVQKYLRSRGYEVRRFGDKTWDFAVRRTNGEPWRVLDPKPGQGGLKEWLYDLMDMTSDVGIGALSAAGGTLGTFAGPGGMVAGSGAGAAAGEAIRQGVGKLSGVDESVDPGAVATQGLMGAAVPGIGHVVKGIAGLIEPSIPGAMNIFRKVGAKVAGIRGTPGMLGEEALDLRANWRGPMPTFEEAAAYLRKTVLSLGNKTTHPFPERQMVERMVNDPAAPHIDARGIFDKIRAYTLDPRAVEKTTTRRILTESEAATSRTGRTAVDAAAEREGQTTNFMAETPEAKPFHSKTESTTTGERTVDSTQSTRKEVTTKRTAEEIEGVPKSYEAALAGRKDPTLHAGAQKAIDDVAAVLNMKGLNEGDLPANVAMDLKDMFQTWARAEHLYDGRPIPRGSKLSLVFGEIADDLKENLTSAFGGSQSAFADLMTKVNAKTRAIGALRDAMGDDLKSTERYIASLHGRARGSAFRELEDLEQVFGLRLKPVSSQIRAAEAASRFGPGGNPELLPLYTATGQFRTLALGGGGYAVGGPVGAIAATLGASPKAIVALTRQANRIAPGFQRALGHIRALPLPASARAAATAGLSEVARVAAGKTVVREDRSSRTVKGLRIGS